MNSLQFVLRRRACYTTTTTTTSRVGSSKEGRDTNISSRRISRHKTPATSLTATMTRRRYGGIWYLAATTTVLSASTTTALLSTTPAFVTLPSPSSVILSTTLPRRLTSVSFHDERRRSTGIRDVVMRSYSSSTLNMSRSGGGDSQKNGGGGGFLSKIGNAVSSLLGTNSEERKQKAAAIERKKEVKNQVSDGIDEMFKGAPLGVRMLGKMVVKPLLGSVASTLAEGMASQAQTMEKVMDDAQRLIMNDPAVVSALGVPIQISPTPFSQSSSMMSVNGQTQSRMQLATNVVGSNRAGIARIVANDDSISQLIVEAGGRVFNIDVTMSSSSSWSSGRSFSSSGTSSSSSSSNKKNDNDIIEAEIIEKKTKP